MMFGKRIFASWRFCSVPYVLIGGGTASYYAALTIRARDPEAKVLIVSDEDQSPYNRQLLSKDALWYGNENTSKGLSYINSNSGKRRDIPYESDGFYPKLEDIADDASSSSEYQHGGIALLRNAKAVKLNTVENFVEMADGKKIGYGKCLIATGSRPKRVEVLQKLGSNGKINQCVSQFANVNDYRILDEVIHRKKHSRIAIVGNGLLGAELAYSLNRRYGPSASDKNKNKEATTIDVVQLFPEAGLLTGILPPPLCDYTTSRMRARGIRVLSNHRVKSAAILDNGEMELQLENTSRTSDVPETSSFGDAQEESVNKLVCDHVVVVTENEPNVEIAKEAGLQLDDVNGGVVADKHMKVSNNVWAAGDVCSFDDPIIGRRRRVRHWEHAQIAGRVAGENMTGGDKPFTHQGSFVSVFGCGDHISGVGDVDSNHDTVSYIIEGTGSQEDSKHEEEDESRVKAIVFYLTRGSDSTSKRVIGVLLYNLFESWDLEIARRIISDKKEFSNPKSFSDLARLFGNSPEGLANEEDKEIENGLLGSSKGSK